MLFACLVLAPLSGTAPSLCATDEDCQMLGHCVSGKCACRSGWTGDHCSTLDIIAGPVLAYAHSNISSWGASVGFEPKDGLYHMYVAEVAAGCGMNTWIKNERIAHATSKSPGGPFVRQAVVGGPMWDNPQAIRLPNGSWALFHDVRGYNKQVFGPCPNGNGTTSKWPGFPNASLITLDPVFPPGSGGSLHIADSPSGPWRGVPFNFSLNGTTRQCPHNPGAAPEKLDFRNCGFFNNPSPFLLKDGRIGVISKSQLGHPLPIWIADDIAGPYVLHSYVTGPRWNTSAYGAAHGEGR